MFVHWSIPNNAFILLAGEDPKTAPLVDLDGQRFFKNKYELEQKLILKGLQLNPRKSWENVNGKLMPFDTIDGTKVTVKENDW